MLRRGVLMFPGALIDRATAAPGVIADRGGVIFVGLDIGVAPGHRAVWLQRTPEGDVELVAAVAAAGRYVPDVLGPLIGDRDRSRVMVVAGRDLTQRGHAGGASAREQFEAAGITSCVAGSTQRGRVDLIGRALSGLGGDSRLRIARDARLVIDALRCGACVSRGGTHHTVVDPDAGHTIDALGYGLQGALGFCQAAMGTVKG